jgi:hypothetical protein
MMILLTEALSVEVYVKDTSVSTSAAPFIGGVLLFGPLGALLLSLVLAGTAMIKKRSQLKRFLFNSSNHLIASSLCAGLVSLLNRPINTGSSASQLALSISSGGIVFMTSTILLAGVMALSMGKSVRQIWIEEFRWLWPYYLAFGFSAFGLVLGYTYAGLFGILALVVPVFALRFSQIQYLDRTRAMVNQLRANNFELERQSEEISTC